MKDGGTVFPNLQDAPWAPEPGISLRDHFAAEAMAAFISEPVNPGQYTAAWRIAGDHGFATDPYKVRLSRVAYLMADAMLAEREGGRTPMADPLTLLIAGLNLRDGERYAGIVLDDEGAPTHHLIVLPGEAASVTWEDAKAWAADIGGELPTRQEQALLYANAKNAFQRNWYWSSEQLASFDDCAWDQDFGDGSQDYSGVHLKLRARAVRRVAI